MRLPNGYGSAAKIGGDKRRRNPWRARVTDGWVFDESKGKAVQKFITLGYFPSKKAALQALADYNKNPVAIGSGALTFSDMYELWLEKEGCNMTAKNLSGYRNSFKRSAPLHKMKMREIKADDMQAVMDALPDGKAIQQKVKILWSKLFKLAIERDYITKDYSEFVRLNSNAKDAEPRRPFTKTEIKILWDNLENVPGADIALIMIYSGMRIGELLTIKREHLHLPDRWIDLHGTKTKAAKRAVPIHSKILPLMEKRAGENYFMESSDGRPMTYSKFMYNFWSPLIDALGFENMTPHHCRHTAISLMTASGLDDRLMRQIVGHSIGGVTANYTHPIIQALVREIDKIQD